MAQKSARLPKSRYRLSVKLSLFNKTHEAKFHVEAKFSVYKPSEQRLVELHLHPFLNSAVDGSNRSDSYPGTIAGTKMIRKYVQKSELYKCAMKCEGKQYLPFEYFTQQSCTYSLTNHKCTVP